jgi:hypothetical protein
VIPDQQLCAGRVLKLDSMDAAPQHTVEFGRRVALKLRVCETGKLTGTFDVVVDIDINAARALAEVVRGAADHAETLTPEKLWGK